MKEHSSKSVKREIPEHFFSTRQFEEIVFKVSKYFCSKYHIHPYDQEDLIQYVRLRVLENKDQIRANYLGRAQLATYLSSVVLNLCREFRKKNCSRSVFAEDNDLDPDVPDKHTSAQEILKGIHISNEVKRLNSILILYGSKEAKIVLMLKAYFHIKITQTDFLKYCDDPSIMANYMLKFMRADKPKKKDVVSLLTSLFNQVENTQKTDEATRKWIERTNKHVIKLLNTGGRKYDQETLGILLEVRFNSVN